MQAYSRTYQRFHLRSCWILSFLILCRIFAPDYDESKLVWKQGQGVTHIELPSFDGLTSLFAGDDYDQF